MPGGPTRAAVSADPENEACTFSDAVAPMRDLVRYLRRKARRSSS